MSKQTYPEELKTEAVSRQGIAGFCPSTLCEKTEEARSFAIVYKHGSNVVLLCFRHN